MLPVSAFSSPMGLQLSKPSRNEPEAQHAEKEPSEMATISTEVASETADTANGSAVVGGKQFYCPHCSLSFMYSYNLSRHKRQKHPDMRLPQAQPQEVAPIETATATEQSAEQIPQMEAKPSTPQQPKATGATGKRPVPIEEVDLLSTTTDGEDDKENIPTSETGQTGRKRPKPVKIPDLTSQRRIITQAEKQFKQDLDRRQAASVFVCRATTTADNDSVISMHLCEQCVISNRALAAQFSRTTQRPGDDQCIIL